jgi:hypothetical protein
MTEIISFVALPFDFTNSGIMAGEPVDCPSPAAAIERAQGLWKVFGHAGSIAFSRTTDFEIGKFNDKHILRRFGQVADEYRWQRSAMLTADERRGADAPTADNGHPIPTECKAEDISRGETVPGFGPKGDMDARLSKNGNCLFPTLDRRWIAASKAVYEVKTINSRYRPLN